MSLRDLLESVEKLQEVVDELNSKGTLSIPRKDDSDRLREVIRESQEDFTALWKASNEVLFRANT